MSVRVNDRRISDIEYENTYSKFYDYILNRMKRVPRRYERYITDPINKILNEIYHNISQATILYIQKKHRSVDRYRVICASIRKIETLICLIYSFYNLSDNKKNQIPYVKERQRAFIAGTINKEIALLTGVAKMCNKDKNIEIKSPKMYVYTKNDIKNVVFLHKLYTIQNIVYKRAILCPRKFKDARMEFLVELSRSSFYNALQANNIYINGNEVLLKRRAKYFSDAISDLYKMNRPILELSFNNIFSEEELSCLCNSISECIKILKSIKESDIKSFNK